MRELAILNYEYIIFQQLMGRLAVFFAEGTLSERLRAWVKSEKGDVSGDSAHMKIIRQSAVELPQPDSPA